MTTLLRWKRGPPRALLLSTATTTTTTTTSAPPPPDQPTICPFHLSPSAPATTCTRYQERQQYRCVGRRPRHPNLDEFRGPPSGQPLNLASSRRCDVFHFLSSCGPKNKLVSVAGHFDKGVFDNPSPRHVTLLQKKKACPPYISRGVSLQRYFSHQSPLPKIHNKNRQIRCKVRRLLGVLQS